MAKLFTQPANLLVLDEPTNDLDIETLELLEEVLLEFSGTVILVSHDRDFMDRVVTSLLVIDEHGNVEEQAGSFSDWEARGGTLLSTVDEARSVTKAAKQSHQIDNNGHHLKEQHAAKSAPQKRKLSYKEQRELDELPELIASLEEQQAKLESKTGSANFFKGDPIEVGKTLEQLTQVSESLDNALERLVELEG